MRWKPAGRHSQRTPRRRPPARTFPELLQCLEETFCVLGRRIKKQVDIARQARVSIMEDGLTPHDHVPHGPLIKDTWKAQDVLRKCGLRHARSTGFPPAPPTTSRFRRLLISDSSGPGGKPIEIPIHHRRSDGHCQYIRPHAIWVSLRPGTTDDFGLQYLAHAPHTNSRFGSSSMEAGMLPRKGSGGSRCHFRTR
jgi:hypothetical protein